MDDDWVNHTAENAKRAWEVLKVAHPESVSLLRYAVNGDTALFVQFGESIMDLHMIPVAVELVPTMVKDERGRKQLEQRPASGHFRFVGIYHDKLSWVDLPMRELTGVDAN